MKRFTALLLSTAFTAAPAVAQQPEGMVVQHGAASASYDDATRTQTINQATHRGVYQWDRFDIGAGETTHFQMPNANSIALNRTLQNDPSQIFGTLSSNGEVILLNPHGVLFGEGSRVDVNGLMVSTGEIDDADFLDGDRRFDLTGIDANPNTAIINNGEISLKDGGWASLVAPRVENNGVISAPMGRVALGSGSAAEVDLTGDGLIRFRAPLTQQPDGAEALVTNRGLIETQGGTVHLTADAVEGLVENVINLEHHAAADRGRIEGGRLILSGGPSGIVRVAGELDARNEEPGETGGRVVVTGELIDVRETAKIDASGDAGGGEILIGGDYQGANVEALDQTYDNAEGVRVEGGAEIIANALNVGDGGRIIVWSDGMTALTADLAARGGDNGGDGGFIEVSGKETLIYRGLSDLRARYGQAGTLLLDPTDITICNCPTSSTLLPLGLVIEETGPTAPAASQIDISDLVAQLGMGDVEIKTASSGAGTGEIRLSDDLIISTGSNLSLIAEGDIFFDAKINSSSVNLIKATSYSGDFVSNDEINILGGLSINVENGEVFFNDLISVGTLSVTSRDIHLSNTANISNDFNITGANGISIGFGDVLTSTDMLIDQAEIDLVTIGNELRVGGLGHVELGNISVNSDVRIGSSSLSGQNGASAQTNGNIFRLRQYRIDSSSIYDFGGYNVLTDGGQFIFEQSSVGAHPVSINILPDLIDTNGGDVNIDSPGIEFEIQNISTSGGNIDIESNDLLLSGDVNTGGGAFSYSLGPSTDCSASSPDCGFTLESSASIFTGIGAIDIDAGFVDMANGASIASTSGQIVIAGRGSVTIRDILSDSGNIQLKSGGSHGGILESTGDIISSTGELNFIARDVEFNGGNGSIFGGGTISIEPTIDSISMGIAGAAGDMQIDNADLDAISGGSGTVEFGKSTSTSLLSIGDRLFGSPVLLQAGTGGISLDSTSSGIQTNGDTITIASTGGVLSSSGVIIDTTNGGAVISGANISLLSGSAGIDLNGHNLMLNAGTGGAAAIDGVTTNVDVASITAANTAIDDSLTADSVTLAGGFATAANGGLHANHLDVQTTSGANLVGSIGGLTGADAAASPDLMIPEGANYTFNGISRGSGAETSTAPDLPDLPVVHFGDDFLDRLRAAHDDLIVIDLSGDDAVDVALNGGLDDGGLGDVDALSDAATGIRDANIEASLGDEALLDGDQPGLVAEILDALDRSNLDENGAPIGPYSERTSLFPGLVYDPDGGVRVATGDEFTQTPRKLFGELHGW